MYIKQNLKKHRKKNKISQAKIAQYLQITQQQYSLYECGEREMPIKLYAMLAKKYNTSIDELVTLVNNNYKAIQIPQRTYLANKAQIAGLKYITKTQTKSKPL